jgi:hypothetical protein
MKNFSLFFKRVYKFIKIPFRAKALLLETFMLTGIIRFAIIFIPFKKLAKIAGKYKEESSKEITDTEKIIVGRIAWAIYITSKFTPWESKCLVKALTAQILLTQRNVSSTLFLGVAKDVENNLQAHAWLRSGANIITGEAESKRFKQVAKFANNPKEG